MCGSIDEALRPVPLLFTIQPRPWTWTSLPPVQPLRFLPLSLFLPPPPSIIPQLMLCFWTYVHGFAVYSLMPTTVNLFLFERLKVHTGLRPFLVPCRMPLSLSLFHTDGFMKCLLEIFMDVVYLYVET